MSFRSYAEFERISDQFDEAKQMITDMIEWLAETLGMHGESQNTYERISYSGITDEQREQMTHVIRGALYRLAASKKTS